MRRLAVALLLSACTGRTELMVGVVTELKAPDLLDEIRLEVDNNLVPVNLGTTDWAIGNGQVGTFVLPGSYGLNSSDGSEPPVQITLTGLKKGNKVVVRSARTSLVTGKTLFMRMGLVVGCMGNFSCPDGQSCIEGSCRDNTVDVHTLPEYRAELVDHITCASGEAFLNTKDNSALPSLGDMQCAGACVEGTCYNPPPDGGTPNQLWTPQPTPPTAAMAQLNAIWGTTSNGYDVWAVGQRADATGVVLHLSGSGPTAASVWTEEGLPAGTPSLNGVSGSSANDIWAVGANSTILHRVNSNWLPSNDPQVGTGLDLRSTSLDAPSEGWIVGDNPQMGNEGGGFFWNGSQWVGAQFTPKPTAPLNAVGVMNGLGLAAGDGAAVYGWSASQGAWMGFGVLDVLAGANLYAVGFDGQYGYVCGQRGVIARALAGGSGTPTVELLSQKAGGDLFGLFAVGRGNVYAVGAGGTILHATDGRTFTQEPSSFSGDLRALWAASASDVYAVGVSGTVLHSSGTVATPVDAGVSAHDLGAPMLDGSAGTPPDMITCGQAGQACCPGNACADPGACCAFGSCVAQGSLCGGDLASICSKGSCGGCGAVSQMCCPSAGCTAAQSSCASADGGMICVQCGQVGLPCCAGGFCARGIACVANVCGG